MRVFYELGNGKLAGKGISKIRQHVKYAPARTCLVTESAALPDLMKLVRRRSTAGGTAPLQPIAGSSGRRFDGETP